MVLDPPVYRLLDPRFHGDDKERTLLSFPRRREPRIKCLLIREKRVAMPLDPRVHGDDKKKDGG